MRSPGHRVAFGDGVGEITGVGRNATRSAARGLSTWARAGLAWMAFLLEEISERRWRFLKSTQACGDPLLAVQAKKKLTELTQAVV